MYLSSVVKPRYANASELFKVIEELWEKPEYTEEIVNVFCTLNGYSKQEVMKKFEETKNTLMQSKDCTKQHRKL